MDKKELQDLQMFGMGIEHTETNDQNKKDKTFDQTSFNSKIQKKKQKFSFKKILQLFQKKITKYFLRLWKDNEENES